MKVPVSLLALLVAAGCSAAPPTRPAPGPRPLAADLAPESPPADDAPAASPRGPLSLEQALRLALRHDPELAAAGHEVAAAAGRARQAGLLPNPELELEVEEFGGRGEREGFGGSEAFLGIAQALPIGGRVGRARRAADLEREVAAWDLEARRLSVVSETAAAFAAVLAAQQRRDAGAEARRLGETVLRSVERQVEAGKVAPLEASKARVEVALLRLRHERLQQDLDTRRRALAARWGESRPAFDRAEGSLDRLRPVPAEERVLERLGANPEIARTAAELALHEAALALAEAEGVPDLVVHAGVARYAETEDHAFAAGLSLDLPLFDRNQGGVAEARANLRKARAERRAAAVGVRNRLVDAHRALILASEQARTLRDDVVPAARAAFDAAEAGFRQGKNGLLDVLDGQRTLIDARAELVDALEAHHAAAAEVERLTGRRLEDLAGPDSAPRATEGDSR